MKLEQKRIFISDLPETATREDIEKAFSNYGNVESIEIKERKELGRKNITLFFAYVNIQIDDKQLQQCFKDFANGEWLGNYVPLQIARESFLERLKRERENNVNVSKAEINTSIPTPISVETTTKRKQPVNGVEKRKRKYEESSESSDSGDDDDAKSPSEPINSDENKRKNLSHDIEEDEIPDLVIKNNRGKVYEKTGLKIASVGKEPIVKVDLSKKNATNSSEANIRRLQSLKNLKKGYQNQKSLIQAALSNVDNNKSSKKIFYDESVENLSKQVVEANHSGVKESSLFDGDDSDEDFEANFAVKEQFQGRKGQQLLELQSKYKNDKRFTLDSRFREDEVPEEACTANEDISLEEEKKKQYEILEQVLGKKISKFQQPESQQKKMLRFDPSQPEHSKYEIPKAEKTKKSKLKKTDVDLHAEKKREEKEVPEVSKEVFYKVTDDLKESLQEKNNFSLLGMFGKPQETEDGEELQPKAGAKTLTNSLVNEKNPFRYDSSDDEDETEDIPTQNDVEMAEKPEENRQQPEARKTSMWHDPFFFKIDDYRLQEGFDFVEKMKSEEKTEFSKLRRNLKEIVKAKVRNNLRKNKMFKKKLGGSRKKKVIRMKKAMKR